MANLKIAGKQWAVRQGRVPKNTWGITKLDKRTITIAPQLTPEEAAPIVGHEIIHVWLNDCGWEAFMNKEQVEALCDVFGKHLSDLVLSHSGDTLKDAFLCRGKK